MSFTPVVPIAAFDGSAYPMVRPMSVNGTAIRITVPAARASRHGAMVASVQTANQKGKVKRFGGRVGRRDHVKKAFVALKPGQELNFSGEAA